MQEYEETLRNRLVLEGITIQLHGVSQMINTGLPSLFKSIDLCEKLLASHKQYLSLAKATDPIHGGPAAYHTQGMLQYTLDAFRHQLSWLEAYKVRKETAMNFVSTYLP